MAVFSFVTVYSTNKISNSYSHMLIPGGLIENCSARVEAYWRGGNSRIFGTFGVSLRTV